MSAANIVAELRQRIVSGKLQPGDRVPSARQIMRKWGVAIATATKVLATLQQEGLVRASPGVGTVVAGPDLSKARIVDAAIAIADREGLAAVSMRRLATELRVATMSLYRHVPSKEELVLVMLDAVFREEALPSKRPRGWRAKLDLLARVQWAIYRRHKWMAATISLTRPVLVPNGMKHTEWALEATDGVVGDAAQQLLVALTLFGFVRGLAASLETETYAEQDTGMSSDDHIEAQTREFEAIVASGAFPMLTRVSAVPDLDVGLDALFEFGLARVLDGIERMVEPRA